MTQSLRFLAETGPNRSAQVQTVDATYFTRESGDLRSVFVTECAKSPLKAILQKVAKEVRSLVYRPGRSGSSTALLEILGWWNQLFRRVT